MRVQTRSRKERSWVMKNSVTPLSISIVFQPFDGGDVEVVGRLVEQQDLGRHGQAWARPGAFLAAGQGADAGFRISPKRSITRSACASMAQAPRAPSSCCRVSMRASRASWSPALRPGGGCDMSWYSASRAEVSPMPDTTAWKTVIAGSNGGSCGT